RTNADQDSRLYTDRYSDACNRYRREYGDLQCSECDLVTSAALQGSRPARGSIRKLACAQSVAYRGRSRHFCGLAGTKSWLSRYGGFRKRGRGAGQKKGNLENSLAKSKTKTVCRVCALRPRSAGFV